MQGPVYLTLSVCNINVHVYMHNIFLYTDIYECVGVLHRRAVEALSTGVTLLHSMQVKYGE